MTAETELRRAIQGRRKIVYTYDREDQAQGEREGEPHVLFFTKNGHLMVHIWKTGGVQTDETKPLPAWRQYRLERLSVVEVQEETFEAQDTFTSLAGYAGIICHVQ